MSFLLCDTDSFLSLDDGSDLLIISSDAAENVYELILHVTKQLDLDARVSTKLEIDLHVRRELEL